MSPRFRLKAPALPPIVAAGILACLTAIPFFPYLMPPPSQELPGKRSPALVAPLRRRVVLVILDGVGARVAYREGSMPLLAARRLRSARGAARARFPTLTPAGLRAILTGRRGLPQPELPDAGSRRVEPDSVLREATVCGLRAFAVGQQEWPALFLGHGAQISWRPYRALGPDYDGGVFREGMDILRGRRGRWDFLALHFFGIDPLGHVHGTEDPVYREHLRQLDGYVDQLTRAAGPRVTFLLTADHGQTPSGGHGGILNDEAMVPVILWGESVRPGELGKTAALLDVAPTLSTLLGVPAPLYSEGMPLLEALSLGQEKRGRALVATLEQKCARWLELKNNWPWLAGEPLAALERVRQMLRFGSWKNAGRLAERASLDAEAAFREASPVRWYGRFLLAESLLVLAGGLMFLWGGARYEKLVRWLLGLVLVSVIAPLLKPSLWPDAALACLIAATAILGCAAAEGYGAPALPWDRWTAGLFALLGLGLPSLIDPLLWSWCAMLLCLLYRLSRRRRAPFSPYWAGAVAALLAYWTFARAPAVGYGSVLRALLPDLRPALGGARSPAASLLLGSAMAAAAARELKTRLSGGPLVLAVLAAVAPWAVAAVLTRSEPLSSDGAFMAWSVLAASLILCRLVPADPRARALWLALAAAAFHRSLAAPTSGPAASLGVLVGWALSRQAQALERPWGALETVGLALWAYLQAGYSLNFSGITVGAVYGSLGGTWHPRLLIILVSLRQLCALGAPIVPLLARKRLEDAASLLPLFGAMSAGHLANVWVDRFWSGRGVIGFSNDEFLSGALWAAALTWTFILWWAASRLWARPIGASPQAELNEAVA